MKRLLLTLVCLAGLLYAAPAMAGTTIDTTASWNHSQSVCTWNGTPTYAQTLLGNGQDLSTFTYYTSAPATATYQAGVYTWAGDRAGTKVWQSGDLNPPVGAGMRADTITLPAGVTLTSGQEYVFLISTLYSAVSVGSGCFGDVTSNPYPDGKFVFTNTGNQADLTGAAWDGLNWDGGNADLAFTAVFNAATPPAPTPAPVDVCNNVPGNQATIPDGWLPDGQGGCFEPNWVMVCLTSAHVRAGDGSLGTFFQILDSQWAAGKSDPNSIYYQAQPAIFVKGYGTMCNISDVFTYGGDPSKFKDASVRVNEVGDPTPDGVSPSDWGAIYELYVPTQ